MEMVHNKVRVKMPVTCVTKMEAVQVQIITIFVSKIIQIIININIIYCISLAFYINILISFREGCVVNGVAGDGTVQGTCPSNTDVCTATGTCISTSYYPN